MDFSSTDLGGSLSKSAKIAKFFGNESTFSKIRALLNKYEIADTSQQYSIMMQIKPLVESWLNKHPVKTKNDNAKKASLIKLLNAIVEEMQNVNLNNQNLTSESNSETSETSESSVVSSSSSISDAPEKTIEKEKVTLDKIASDDLSESLDSESETIEVEAEDIVSEAELADPKPDDPVDVAKLQSDYLNDLNSGKFKFLTKDVALSKDLTKARSEGEDLASDYSLTAAEHTAIRIYTGRDYSYMNPVLANNDGWLDSKVKENTDKNKWSSFDKDTLDDQEREQIKEEGKRHSDMAVMGLKKLPDENIETYRGLGLSKKDFDDQYQPGKELSYPAFTSTSTNKAVSADFAKSESKGGKVGILILLQVTKGKDINKLSIYPGEGEILLLPGAKFKIGLITPPSSPGEFYTVKADQTS